MTIRMEIHRQGQPVEVAVTLLLGENDDRLEITRTEPEVELMPEEKIFALLRGWDKLEKQK